MSSSHDVICDTLWPAKKVTVRLPTFWHYFLVDLAQG